MFSSFTISDSNLYQLLSIYEFFIKRIRVLHQKGRFLCKKQATEAILAAEFWNEKLTLSS